LEGPRKSALNLARGRLAGLEEAIAAAASDYRDVLWWGESSQFEHLWAVDHDPGEGPVDPAEEAFLQGIRADPLDNTVRLVYADWLAERGDPRADYVRVLCAWLALRRPASGAALIERERELRAGLDPGWLARVRGMAVRKKKRRGKG
jgi:uncharacterized protein (TIGR02996 family)